jgi:hypothetical protein
MFARALDNTSTPRPRPSVCTHETAWGTGHIFVKSVTTERSRYGDWLQAGRPRGRSSSPDRGKHFLFSMSPRRILGPNQPPIQWVRKALSLGVKRPGPEADDSPPTSAEDKKT